MINRMYYTEKNKHIVQSIYKCIWLVQKEHMSRSCYIHAPLHLANGNGNGAEFDGK